MSEAPDLQTDHEGDPTARDELLGEVCRACRGTGQVEELSCPKCGGIGWAVDVTGDF